MSLEKKDFMNDLYLFYRYFIISQYDDAVPAPHIKKLSRYLMKLKLGGGKNRLAVSMPPRHKLADSTPILTTHGWTTHGELKVGDYVYGLDGKPTEIIGVSDKSLCNQLVTFSDGSQILAHEEHLWTVSKRGNKGLKTIPTSEIKKDYSYIEKNGKKRYRYQLPFINPLNYPKINLPLDPYFLGLWLGDGSSTKPCITHASEDIESIQSIPYEISTVATHKETGVKTTYFSNQNILQTLRKLGLYDNKHIPEIYKRSCVEDRLELLAGLIDSDGSVDKNGRVRFVNTNKKLIDDVYELCVGLGLYPYISIRDKDMMNNYKRNSKYDIKSTQDAYVVGFQPKYEIPTRIPRKQISRTSTHRRLSIIDITTIDGELGKCIEIENPDGIYLAGEKLIPTHNSKSSMVTLAFPLWLILQNPNLNIMIIAGSSGLKENFGIELREQISRIGKFFNIYLSDVKYSNSHLMFCNEDKELYQGGIMLFTSGGGITGNDADYLILDDPYKGNDDEFTPTALQKKIDWVNRVVEQRIEPHTKYCVLHTRWHANDIIGHYKKVANDKYDFVSFPALDEDNKPLWSQKYTTKYLLEKKASVGERVFSSVYQQIPLDQTSDYFNMRHLHFGLPEDYENLLSVRAWDIASSEEISGNDYTAGLKAIKSPGNKFIIKPFVHGRFGRDTKNKVVETAQDDTPNVHVMLETGVAAAGDLLYQEWRKQLSGFIVEQAKPIKSKVDRATPLQNAIEDGKVYVDISDPILRQKLLDEFSSFPNGEHDDIVDATAHAYNYLFKKNDENTAMLGVVYL